MFTRLCVDLDRAGNVAGCSYEYHGDDGVQSFGTVLHGPFDPPEEVFAELLASHRHQLGEQLDLF